MSVSIVSLNIEGNKHFELFLPFLKAQTPDIVCLQELLKQDIPRVEQELGAKCFFVPMLKKTEDPESAQGIGIFSSHQFVNTSSAYYGGTRELKVVDNTNIDTRAVTQSFSLSLCDIDVRGTVYRVGSTHFPWTPDGSASEFQRTSLKNLLSIVREQGDIVFCGDFNAPRGQEIFTAISKEFKDNVPLEYTSSLDPVLHRAAPLHLMVDGLFSTPGYKVTDVQMVGGLSDHCAL